jgi:nicotinamidase-related amidase
MSHAPKSLLEMARASLQPGSFATSALILIDHQREYLASGGLPLVGVEAAVEEIAHLLAQARGQGTPVFHIVHHARPGARLFDPGRAATQIIQGLEPTSGEAVITKSLPNAFAGTDLHTQLQAMGRRELIVAGFATHMCISSTVRAALDLGYRTTVVASATATRDLPSPTVHGGIVPADTVPAGTLAALADRFAIVVPNTAALPGCS